MPILREGIQLDGGDARDDHDVEEEVADAR